MEKVKLGIVGPGLIWEREHKPALNQLSDLFEISAFCASSESNKNKIQKEYPGLPFFSDYKEMVQYPGIDAVVVLTPISLNTPVTIAALDHNKDVIVEKPMSENSASAKKLMEKEKSSEKKVLILEQNAFMKKAEELKKIVESGTLGEIIFYDLLWHDFLCEEGNELSYGNTEWRKNPDFQLGTLYDCGIHEIALLSKIFGTPKSVYAASAENYRADYGSLEQVTVLFEYGKYLRGFYSQSSFLPNKRNYFNIRGTEGLAYLEGDKIIIEKNNGDREEKDITDQNIHYKMWSDMYETMAGRLDSKYTTEDSLKDILILEAIGDSLKKSNKVAITY